ncbi:hypothetical protein RHSIM_Rhsim10G0015100 [Rhododendron simsii]|uniref:Ribosomal RNA-processing protein 8 n=1 Tax=Rhododendron simsii TaxID=118357 RepID=A0A834LDL4_RHOSS|nr:hypothetical protein RHSIM_Rhsim10G0015100 [Rhododendron simsii]
MAKLTPDCPTGAVSFVQEMGSRSIDWHSVSDYLRTEESLEDYAKFRHSLMDNYSSLVLSAATENEVPFGWYANVELRTLDTYYFIASLRSSRHKRHAGLSNEMFQDVLPEWKGFSSPMACEVHRHNFDLGFELFELKRIHSYYAYAKSLSKCNFIKLDSDFEEIFQRLTSENRWPELSDDFLRALLENHFSLLHELNDNLSVMDVSAGNRLVGNRVLEAINKLYAKEFGDTTKNYEELWINKYFVPHMKYKSMVQKRLDQARVLRTEYIAQESHLTTQNRFELKNRALVAKSWILEKLSQTKGRGGGQYRGPGTRCVPGLLLVFAPLTAMMALFSGWLLIAEVKSRFDPNNGGAGPDKFSKAICELGFASVSKDFSNKMFILQYFREKEKRNSKNREIEWPELNPCLYKRQ